MPEKATAAAALGTIHEQLARALPTPVRRITLDPRAVRDGTRDTHVWLKDDGPTAQAYGGNKVRKLAPLLEDALRRGKRRIVTFGAAGSHHVLCTSLHAHALGLRTAAGLSPQPHTEHAENVLRCSLASGVEAMAVRDTASALRFVRSLARDDYLIGPGGMGALGASGYFAAALELDAQVEDGAVPEPDWLVLATGSGSTAAGLLAGLAATRLRTRLLGVLAAPNPAIRPIVLAQAAATARRCGQTLRLAEANARLEFDGSRVGAGYGYPLPLPAEVVASAASAGLALDPTYTAKAFGVAVELARRAPSQVVLFWNTLSTTALDPLLERAPALSDLPPDVQKLLRPIPRSGSR